MSYRPAAGAIPTEPGVYRFRDPSGQVIYVGKAKNLRARLSNYFQDLYALAPRTRLMVTTASAVEWTVVATEVEALQLEFSWIKEFDPRFNVRYRDDKSYPMLAVSLNEEYPRLFVYRGARRKGVRYFGPYSHVWAIRNTVDLLTKVFPARTCSNGVFKRHGQIGRPCLLGYIDKCSAPCVGAVSAAEHRRIVQSFCEFLAGGADNLVRETRKRMLAAAEALDFEAAARLRDELAALDKALEHQTVVLADGSDADVVAFDYDELEVAVQVFQVREGRVRGQRGWVVDNAYSPGPHGDRTRDGRGWEAASRREMVEEFLLQFYGDLAELESVADRFGQSDRMSAVPKEVLVPELPDDVEGFATWLSTLRGTPVALRVPRRGDKRKLMETVARNAHETLAQHKLRRSGDFTERSAALQEIYEAFDLPAPPIRIECVDVSHVQGTDVVASLVVFDDGLPKKADYRHYTIKGAMGADGAPQNDDTRSVAEVIARRFAKRGDRPDPGLLVIDGGQPQVRAAHKALVELGAADIPVVGLAKRLEELWLPDDDDPVILPRRSPGLFLLQRVRDEAHRFAIAHHRKKRSKRMTVSALDEVKGLGERRRAQLVKHFGSVRKLADASADEIAALPGFGPVLAESVVTALAACQTPPQEASA
ncbi:excinuclease ABC, C subunit [Segniliparus rotundus DSM 44985]|uniref:UvrABC system protein C n=1 Tax=Segniliparus rotundus (strain ATCC BAA-972 / CDC 1076 / CIP 108378 / DSM 44985 / JCM 13578) TaxID=640132 RepID=D6ZCQ1_SEGRD|nr:excinuclease ABC, C subunit [Segniliparus rotundus DSM 44985]